ncbi:transposase [Corynebacterium diphtheriae]|nr:transposase [Corynebacterium diphtheriae]OLO21987.1 transposase [Corynebacterium diphtheriae]OMO44372.1 transposase [Corynebacterium diphtheriae]
MPRVLFLGLCLDFHYSLTGVVFPKLGFAFSQGAVAQTLVKP